MGFGHRVYRTDDPRALILKDIARKFAEKDAETRKWLEIAERTEAVMWEKRKIKPNIEFYAGVVLKALGVPNDVLLAFSAGTGLAGWLSTSFGRYGSNGISVLVSGSVGAEERRWIR